MLQLMEEGLASEEFDVPVDAFMEILSIMREFEGVCFRLSHTHTHTHTPMHTHTYLYTHTDASVDSY